ncbi:MAG: hypothetical protein AAF639_36240, partial [Chloroflexota bacterium]
VFFTCVFKNCLMLYSGIFVNILFFFTLNPSPSLLAERHICSAGIAAILPHFYAHIEKPTPKRTLRPQAIPAVIGNPNEAAPIGDDDASGQTATYELRDGDTAAIHFRFVNQGSALDIATYHLILPTPDETGTQGYVIFNPEATLAQLPTNSGFELFERNGQWFIVGPLLTGEQHITFIIEAVSGRIDHQITGENIQLVIRNADEVDLLVLTAGAGNNLFIPTTTPIWRRFLPLITR